MLVHILGIRVIIRFSYKRLSCNMLLDVHTKRLYDVQHVRPSKRVRLTILKAVMPMD